MSKRPFRFSVQDQTTTLEDWQELARKVEDLGFSALVMQDHFGAQLAPLPALVSAAAVTSRLRLGTLVLDNDFRHPAALAKEAATVDVLTGGRLELGLGAGWMAGDYSKTGITYGEPAERFGRLRETVHIVKGFFSEAETVTFKGKYYQIEALDASPKTTQMPPPILIGGRQKQMLQFAAREANIVSISMLDRFAGVTNPPTYAEKVAWVREAAGARYEDIELHVNASNIAVTDDADGALAAIAERLKITPEDALDTPATLVGSVDAIVERLLMWREKCDVSYFNLQRRFMDQFAPVVAKLAGR
jgi:probable F420-dependent oxidoreductase